MTPAEYRERHAHYDQQITNLMDQLTMCASDERLAAGNLDTGDYINHMWRQSRYLQIRDLLSYVAPRLHEIEEHAERANQS